MIDLMGRRSFAEIVCLIFKGDLQSEREGKLMNAILASSVVHGLTLPSVLGTCTVISTGGVWDGACLSSLSSWICSARARGKDARKTGAYLGIIEYEYDGPQQRQLSH
jgi:hypothetical protein